MRRASARLFVPCCLALCRASAAQESPQSDPFLEARAALEDLRYEDAIAAVRPLTESNELRRRVQALEITAVAHLVLGEVVEGKTAIARLYEIAPGFLLNDPSLPPRVTSAFEAEAGRPHARAVTPTLRASPGSDRAGFELVAGGEVDRVDVACRADAKEPFAPIATARSRSVHAFRLPTLRQHRCFAVALDREGLPLGWLGSRKAPFDLRPRPLPAPPPLPPPVTSRWWFWSGIGVAVAGAAVVTIVVTRPGPEPPAADLTVTARQAGLRW